MAVFGEVGTKYFSAWSNEIQQFKEKYESSIIQRIKLFFGFYRAEWLEHQKKLNTYCNRLSQQRSLKDLRFSYVCIMGEKQNASKTQKDLDFLRRAESFFKNTIQCHFNRLIESKKSVGFNWKVTNKKTQVTHYVVGTCHPATKNMINNVAIQTALKNTKLLISEMECVGRIFTFLHECERWLLSRPLARYILDFEIKKIAWSRKIKIIELETIRETLKINDRMSLEIKNQNLNSEEQEKNKKAKTVVRVNNWFTDQIAEFIAIEGWQKGHFDEGFINEGIPKFISKERNVKWLKSVSLEDIDGKKYTGLLEFLKSTKTPTCIAVGAGHCLDGEENQGIIWALQEDRGYVVERIVS